MFYPVFLNLEGKRVVVIGGGEVAERKVSSLLGCGALVTVISPEVTPVLETLARSDAVLLHRRRYAAGDCGGTFLVFCATDDPVLHKAVWADAQQAGVLVNTADQPALCDFITPAVVQRGDLTVAISTSGKSPALGARLRRRLSRLLGPEYGELLELLAEVRPEIRNRIFDIERRKEIHYKILRSGVLGLLRRRDREGARRLVRQVIENFAFQEQATR